ncbi:MAG: glucose PTS transporter subunit IIA, partial [Carnobacterium sp.]|uniref:glucose PTS transporter subunit IIA n=1 Tax=Carnobacterium sp. TaxID=48221 RepID=UPI002FC585F6
SLSFAATLSGIFAGVTEPILYGLILRYKKLMPLLLVSGAVGGAIIALFDVRVYAFVFPGFLTIPAFTPTLGYIFGIGASFVLAAILAFIFGTEGKKKAVETEAETKAAMATEGSPTITDNQVKETVELSAPLAGEMIPLEDVDDPVFSSGAMGNGAAIEPSEGIVIAPFDGKVATLFPTKHAIGLISDTGIEVLIHIGLDTVQLKGKHYESFVEAGDTVKKGQKLIEFNIAGIQEDGYKTTTPVIITNTADYLDVLPTASRYVDAESNLLTVVK